MISYLTSFISRVIHSSVLENAEKVVLDAYESLKPVPEPEPEPAKEEEPKEEVKPEETIVI